MTTYIIAYEDQFYVGKSPIDETGNMLITPNKDEARGFETHREAEIFIAGLVMVCNRDQRRFEVIEGGTE